MKVLLVGGGGREHALAWKLLRDDPSAELLAAPGNPGIAEIAQCVPLPADHRELVALARREGVTFTVVGPEAPLAEGIVDRFRAAGQAIFGPTAAAARVESSKSFAKSLMEEAGVPTARAERHTMLDEARRALGRFGAPVVIKASGLAAGKGVFVCGSTTEAETALTSMLREHTFGEAGSEILIEEFMEGEELSVFAISDGHAVLPMLPAQDHKRIGEGDTGPNTGGMGAYAPVSLASGELMEEVVDRVFLPTLTALRDRGSPFSGLLYAGLMLTSNGPMVVEFNCRFGDPETQALLPLLDSSLLDLLHAVAAGESIAGARLEWRAAHSVTTVVAAAGYPDAPRKGDVITLPAVGPDTTIFHAGTSRRADGALVTSGGRVFAVTGVGTDFTSACAASVAGAEAIRFDGRQFRRDIGWREQRRHAGAT
jgi:phosphoribosylamine---glycine ligase